MVWNVAALTNKNELLVLKATHFGNDTNASVHPVISCTATARNLHAAEMIYIVIFSPKAMLKANKASITTERVAAAWTSCSSTRCEDDVLLCLFCSLDLLHSARSTQGTASYGNTLRASTNWTTTFELPFDNFINGQVESAEGHDVAHPGAGTVEEGGHATLLNRPAPRFGKSLVNPRVKHHLSLHQIHRVCNITGDSTG
mmetsp:Transcript_32361/g.95362  ORF Transcript_32361/g.95362 Transcript_32361/m.95362 type:complete len:200 (-) Transcript_32361:793-1392(-)